MNNDRNYPDVRSELFIDPAGPHGVAHSKRVMILAETLGIMHGCTKQEIVALRKASAYHDIGRVDNSVDEGHGAKSSTKAIKLKLLKPKKYMDADEMAMVIICEHSLPDLENPPESRIATLVNIFKDADALDRARFGNEECGLDTKYLRTGHAKQLVGFAHMLLRQIPEVPRTAYPWINI